MGFEISLCKFHKNSLSERILEGKAVTLWEEITEHKAVSQKASFQFLTEDISFFTIALLNFQISLCKFHKNSLSERLLEGKPLTLWVQLTEHKAFSHKPSFQFLTEDIFPFHHSPLWASKYHFAYTTRIVLAKGFLRKNCKYVKWINRTQSSFSESFFTVFNRREFLFHRSPLWASKYHFANPTRTVLAKGFLRGKL